MTDAKHTRTYTRTCVCKKKNKSRGEFRVWLSVLNKFIDQFWVSILFTVLNK